MRWIDIIITVVAVVAGIYVGRFNLANNGDYELRNDALTRVTPIGKVEIPITSETTFKLAWSSPQASSYEIAFKDKTVQIMPFYVQNGDALIKELKSRVVEMNKSAGRESN